MAEHSEESSSKPESLMEKMADKLHGHDSSSSSDSDNEKSELSASFVKAKIYRLFGREKPVHKVLGGGKRTDLPSFLFPFFFQSFLHLGYEKFIFL